MRTVVLDDEQPAVEILKGFVSKIPFLDLKLATVNAFEALEVLNGSEVDLLLLDIEMPDITGLELIGVLKKKPLVILTTAYEDYALKGYELDVVDYLMKPIRFERFLKAINKAQRLHELENPPESTSNSFLHLKVEYKTIKVAFDDILYIEGLKDYVKVFTRNKMYLTRLNVKNIESKLPASDFLRIHRSYIVSLSKIGSFQKSQVHVGDVSLPIGASYQDDVMSKLA